jgi:hypothetical protein
MYDRIVSRLEAVLRIANTLRVWVYPHAGQAAPAARGRGGRRGGAPLGWKEQSKIQFRFKPDGVNLTGTADVMLGDVKWLKFNYDLSKKRSRYRESLQEQILATNLRPCRQ